MLNTAESVDSFTSEYLKENPVTLKSTTEKMNYPEAYNLSTQRYL